MDMIQTLNAQLTMMMFFALMPMLGMMRAKRGQRGKIKIFVPEAYHRVVDRAIQVWGAAGVSGDLPLAAMYQGARTLRLADGPDEVHRAAIAKQELRGRTPRWLYPLG